MLHEEQPRGFFFEPVVQEKMMFNGNSYLELLQPLCSVEWNICANLKAGIMGNIQVKLYEIWTSGLGGYVV